MRDSFPTSGVDAAIKRNARRAGSFVNTTPPPPPTLQPRSAKAPDGNMSGSLVFNQDFPFPRQLASEHTIPRT